MYDKRKLRPWLNRHLTAARSDGDEVTGFSIVHMGPNGSSTLDVVPPPSETMNGEDYIENVMELASENAVVFSNSQPGPQTFRIVVNFGESESLYFQFRHVGENESGNNYGGSEPANSDGMVAQAMRHSEANSRLTLQAFMSTQSAQSMMIDKLSGMVERLFDDKMQTIGMVEELYSRKEQRESQARRDAMKATIVEEGVSKLSQLLPILVWKVTGKNILGATQTPTEAVIDSFVENIDEKQFEEIVGPHSMFKPEQRMQLLTLIESARKRNEAKLASVAKTNKRLGGATEEDDKPRKKKEDLTPI